MRNIVQLQPIFADFIEIFTWPWLNRNDFYSQIRLMQY